MFFVIIFWFHFNEFHWNLILVFIQLVEYYLQILVLILMFCYFTKFTSLNLMHTNYNHCYYYRYPYYYYGIICQTTDVYL